MAPRQRQAALESTPSSAVLAPHPKVTTSVAHVRFISTDPLLRYDYRG